MADTMDLDPQLREFLEKSNMLDGTEDGSGLPIQQLRQGFEGPYKYDLPAHRCYCCGMSIDTDQLCNVLRSVRHVTKLTGHMTVVSATCM